jgi:hypothetical protein
MKRASIYFFLAIVALIFAPLSANAQKNNVLFIVDFSGSMNEKVSGEQKVVAAKKAFRETMLQLEPSTNVGLMVFGQTRPGKHCDDISVLSPLGQRPAKQLAGSIENLQAKGWTPIADSLLRARAMFASLKDDNNSVVLITDGREECGKDVCAAAEELKAMGVGLMIHIVGLGHKDEDREAVECAATRTGGKYVAATDAKTLKDALEIVIAPPPPPPVIAQAPTPPPSRGERCRSNDFFNVCLTEIVAKGRSVFVSLSVTNKTDRAIKILMYGGPGGNGWAQLTAPTGEQQIRGGNGFYWILSANASELFSYDFDMSKPVERNSKFDFMFSFNEPSSRFSFLNVPVVGPSTERQSTKLPICKKGQFFEACVTDISHKGQSVTVEYSLKNLTDRSIKISRYPMSAIIVDSNGQKEDGRNIEQVINGGSTAQLSENFVFRHPVQASVFDVIFLLGEPWSQFGFFNVNAN